MHHPHVCGPARLPGRKLVVVKISRSYTGGTGGTVAVPLFGGLEMQMLSPGGLERTLGATGAGSARFFVFGWDISLLGLMIRVDRGTTTLAQGQRLMYV